MTNKHHIEPTDNHKQEENNKIKNNKTKELQENNKEEKKDEKNRAALRAVRRYRRADGEGFPKGEMASGSPDEGHSVPGGATAVLAENDKADEMEFFTEIDMSDFTWDAEDDTNWGVDLTQYQAESVQDPDEKEWIEAHELFNQLWNKYPIKEGKHKVSDAQIICIVQEVRIFIQL